MAGGPLAQTMECLVCGARAERIYEGDEDDTYRCEQQHQFNVEWREPATEALWPPATKPDASATKKEPNK